MAVHHEVHLEEYVVKKLVENGWVEGKSANYDQQLCLYPEDTIAWIKATQPKVYKDMEKNNGPDTDRVILNRLEKEYICARTLSAIYACLIIDGCTVFPNRF